MGQNQQLGQSEEEKKELFHTKTGKSIRKLAYECIYQVVAQDFNLFLGSVGAQRVLSAYQPMAEYSGHAMARNFINKLEMKGDGADIVAIPFYAFINNLLNCSCDPIEIRERGVEVRVTSCYMSKVGVLPEFCVAGSHYAGNGIAKEINPEFEMVFTHHLTQDDPFCRYVVKRKSDRMGDIGNLGKILKVLPPIELPESEKEALTTSYTCTIWMNTIRAMLEVLGSEDTIAFIDIASRFKGEEFGKDAKNLLGIENADARDVELVIETLGSALVQDHKRLEDSSDLVRAEIVGCALMDGPIEACKQFELLAGGVCKSISPTYEFSYDRMMAKGDKTCHWTIRKKRELVKEKVKEEEASDDPVKTLTMRFARGEITEEELEKKISHLRRLGLVT
jgi:hypothetical protein